MGKCIQKFGGIYLNTNSYSIFLSMDTSLELHLQFITKINVISLWEYILLKIYIIHKKPISSYLEMNDMGPEW